MRQPLQVQIPTPCHENWQAMTPNEKGRHCISCQKTVIDFTNMSDRQILEYINNASSNVCGRFSNDQLNKDLVVPSNKKRFSWSYVWNIAFASFLVTSKVNAQTCQRTMGDTTIVNEARPLIMGKVAYHNNRLIIGQVLDAITNQPVQNATIKFKGSNLKLSVNALGNFSYTPGFGLHALGVSAKGYNSITQTINIENPGPIKIYLQPNHRKAVKEREEQLAKESKNFLSGEVIIIRRTKPRVNVSTTQKIIRSITDSVLAPFKKDIKIYPNPVIKGSSINLSLSLREAGEYRMELMDEEGRVVSIQSLTMNAKEQVAQLETNTAWSTGTYWLRISGKNNKSVYQGKVLIQ